jgi:hypothetical protein
MNQRTRGRTLGVIFVGMAIIMITTVFGSIIRIYSVWFSWTLIVVTVAVAVAVLYLGQRINAALAAGLLALPLILAAIGIALTI